ncbi:hypothetical protein KV697_10950 [Sphingomonas sanguinis]|uniref:hypothetical protein n=1 Tax=Sphingomonas sanguinis TaxID=33051 RepID=UPI001C590E88|nr:hypothetical protein [Sphingomonas sanguinis]QXT34351.1 hypothetical protein KV697_10950 [Sphingomonas sanguinis]
MRFRRRFRASKALRSREAEMTFASARATSKLINGLTAKFQGKKPGSDPVHRGSIDENEPDAKPWEHNRFETPAERIATVETLLDTAQELSQLHYKRYPRTELFALKARHAALEAEEQQLKAMSPADRPIGRLATVRQEFLAIDAELERARLRMRPFDVSILRAILSFLNAKTGEIFPSGEEIAARAVCCVKGVWRSLERLLHHGFIDRVRRSRRKPDSDGQFGPQREQTSHAYFLNHRKAMPNRIYQRFLQLRGRRWKRLGRNKPAPTNDAPAAPTGFLSAKSALGEAVRSLGVSVANASP